MTQQEFQDVLKFLEETPAVLRQLSGELANGQLRWKPSELDFSVLEQVCHLRDIEVEGYGARIGKLLTEAQPFLLDLDGSRLARERAYNEQDFDAALTDFTRAREKNLQVIRPLTPTQLSFAGELEGIGRVTLGGLLLLMREHDQSHREELRDLRRRLRDTSSTSEDSRPGAIL